MHRPTVSHAQSAPPGAVVPARTPVLRVDADEYVEAVLSVAELIPRGWVLTYGDIAELLECGGPRQVGRALSRSTRDVPWWRVLRAGGHPPRGTALRARQHYDDEGTSLLLPTAPADGGDYRVDLQQARWSPSDSEQLRVAGLGASLRRAGS